MYIINQICITQSTFVKLHPNEYTQGLPFYTFAVNLDRCVGSCNTLDNLSKRSCVPNKRKDLNKHFQHDYWNKQFKNINETYMIQV